MDTVVNSSNAALMRRIVQLENGMLPLFYHYPQIRMQFRVYVKSLRKTAILFTSGSGTK
jgi:hypothetical protein